MRTIIVLAVACALMLGSDEILIPKRDRVLSSLPVWNDLSSYRDGKYVYGTADPAAFVIAYPRNLEDPTDPDRSLIVNRFRLQNEVAPAVTGTPVWRPGEHRFLYSYRVSNGKMAREAIWDWSLIGESADSDPILDGALRGTSGAAKHHLIPGVPPGVYISWTDIDNPIRPGQTKDGFRISSHFLPGLTTAAFVGGPAIAVSEELPLAVSEQLLPFFWPEVTNQLRVCVGPRYSPHLSLAQWSEAFTKSLRELMTVMPRLRRSSWISDLLAAMDGLSGSATEASIQKCALLKRTSDPLESEIREIVVVMIARQ